MKIPLKIALIISGLLVPSTSVPLVLSNIKRSQPTSPQTIDKVRTPETDRIEWSSSFSPLLNATNKKTYDDLKKLHEDFTSKKEEKLKSLEDKIKNFNSCFQKFNDNVAAGWNWDWWSNVQKRLTNDETCLTQINLSNSTQNNSDEELTKIFKSDSNFLNSVQSETNLQEQHKSNFRLWLTSIDAEFAEFNKRVDNYKAKKECSINLTSKYNYFYKYQANECLKLPS